MAQEQKGNAGNHPIKLAPSSPRRDLPRKTRRIRTVPTSDTSSTMLASPALILHKCKATTASLQLLFACLLLFLAIEQSDSFAPLATTMTRMQSSSTLTMEQQQQQSATTPMSFKRPHQQVSSSHSLLQLFSNKSAESASSSPKNDAAETPALRRNLPKAAALSAAALSTILFPSLAAHAASIAALPTNAQSILSSLTSTGFYQAFSLVFLSELGDKTFFIAGLLAMKTSRWISFIGSIAALAVMTVLSVLIGQIFHAVPSGIADGIPLDDICAVAAFLFFGIKTLSDALAMDPEGGASSVMDEEFQEAQETVAETETGMINTNSLSQIATIFGLVFAAELGDRSFLSTIALSAAQAPVAVALGAIAAHAVATGIAVASGAVVAKYLSERVIGIIGGSLFLVFAVTTAIGIF